MDRARDLLGRPVGPTGQPLAGPGVDAAPVAGPGDGGPTQPLSGTQGGPEPRSPAPAPEAAPKSLIDKVKQTIKSLFPGQSSPGPPSTAPTPGPEGVPAVWEDVPVDDLDTPPAAAPLPSGPPPRAVMLMMIRQAGRAQQLLLFKYSGAWRLIEPYEIKAPKKPGAEPLFYMYCLLHNEIHSVYLSRCGGMVMTDETFTPRWPIKVAI